MKVSHPFKPFSHLLVNNNNIIFYHSTSSDPYTVLLSMLRYPTCCSGITSCCYGIIAYCYGITSSAFLHSPTYSDSQIESSKYPSSRSTVMHVQKSKCMYGRYMHRCMYMHRDMCKNRCMYSPSIYLNFCACIIVSIQDLFHSFIGVQVDNPQQPRRSCCRIESSNAYLGPR